MSVLIKGMEMPKNCDECFFVGRGFPDWCSLPQIQKDEDEIDDTNNRPDWCPLEEVPETHEKRTETHACDLISRQALCEYALNQKDKSVTPNDIMRFPSAQPEKVDTPTVDTPTCEDAVSRQAVYNVLDKMPIRGFKKDGETIHGLISLSQVNSAIINLPSVQPEPLDEWCTDCKEYDHERHCCPRWNRVIRQTLKDMKEEQPEIIRCKDCKHWKRQTAYNGNPLSFGFCESDYMWRSLYGETYEVAHIDTDDDFYCGYAERRNDG